jgi:general secretion pathway protein M
MKMLRFPMQLRMPGWALQASRTGAAHWHRLSPREKRLAGLAGVVVMTALIWVMALQPAMQTVERLGTALPRLRADAARLDAVIREARQLSAASRPQVLTAGQTPQALREALEQAGLAQTASVILASAGTWQILLDRAPVQEALAWLQDMPFVLRLQATEVSLHRSVDEQGRMLSGVVSGSITVVLPAGGRP